MSRTDKSKKLVFAKRWGEVELGSTANVFGAPLLGEGDVPEFVVIVMVAMHHLRTVQLMPNGTGPVRLYGTGKSSYCLAMWLS